MVPTDDNSHNNRDDPSTDCGKWGILVAKAHIVHEWRPSTALPKEPCRAAAPAVPSHCPTRSHHLTIIRQASPKRLVLPPKRDTRSSAPGSRNQARQTQADTAGGCYSHGRSAASMLFIIRTAQVPPQPSRGFAFSSLSQAFLALESPPWPDPFTGALAIRRSTIFSRSPLPADALARRPNHDGGWCSRPSLCGL